MRPVILLLDQCFWWGAETWQVGRDEREIYIFFYGNAFLYRQYILIDVGVLIAAGQFKKNFSLV